MNEASLVIQFQGSQTSVAIMQEFWVNAISQESLERLGRHVVCKANRVEFKPIPSTGVCPTPIFQDILAVNAARAVLSQSNTFTNAREVLIKWGRPVWKRIFAPGYIHPDHPNAAAICFFSGHQAETHQTDSQRPPANARNTLASP